MQIQIRVRTSQPKNTLPKNRQNKTNLANLEEETGATEKNAASKTSDLDSATKTNNRHKALIPRLTRPKK